MVNCLNFEIRIKSSVFDGLKRTTVSPFVYAVFPSHDVYMEVAMCIRLIDTIRYDFADTTADCAT